MTQLIDGGAGDVMIFDERIGGFSRAAQRVPKGRVHDHSFPSLSLHKISMYLYLMQSLCS